MNYLAIGAPSPRKRLAAAEARAEMLMENGYDVSIPPDAVPEERVRKIVDNFDHGYFVVPREAFFVDSRFDYKHGLVKPMPATADLRTLKDDIPRSLPLTLRMDTDGLEAILPAQVSTIQFNTPLSDYYWFMNTDVVSALMAYDSLHPTLKLTKEPRGRVVAQYAGGVKLTFLGLYFRQPSDLTVLASGLPSRSATDKHQNTESPVAEKSYAPQYTIETLNPFGKADPIGAFRIDSATPPWKTTMRQFYRVWGDHIQEEKLKQKRSVGTHLKLRALYMQDILGLLLMDGVARRRFNLEFNHPFRRYDVRERTRAQNIYERSVILEDGEPRWPTKAEAEQLFNVSLAVHKDNIAGTKERFRPVLL